MTIEAPISKFKKNNLKIYIVVLVAFASWCVYDGYFNEEWEKKYTDADGNPKSYLVFNRKAPQFLFGAVALLGAYLFAIKNKKIVADEGELIISDKKRIPYDSILKIDKTHFDSKGFFSITYKDKNDKEVDQKLNDRTYDNLAAVLDRLVEKIS